MRRSAKGASQSTHGADAAHIVTELTNSHTLEGGRPQHSSSPDGIPPQPLTLVPPDNLMPAAAPFGSPPAPGAG